MWSTLKSLIWQTFTGKDNKTLDMGRILWCQGVFVFFGLSIAALVDGQPFDPSAWGMGLGAVLAGGGAAIALKSHTEPEDKDGDGNPD